VVTKQPESDIPDVREYIYVDTTVPAWDDDEPDDA